MSSLPNKDIRRAARVLIVQPQRRYLTVLARRIAGAGFRVAAADRVQAAVAELYRQPVDLILADIGGRHSSGVELLGIVRGDALLRDTPILMMGGRGDRAAAVRALRAGADDIILKPFHFEVLVARIERELQRRRTIDDLRRDNSILDARIVERAIALGEMKDRLAQSEAMRLRLELTAVSARP